MIRRAAGKMDQRTVVPEHQVVRLPAMAIDVLGAHAVREQFGQQRAAFVFRHIADARREAFTHEQRAAAVFGVRTHHRMHHFLHLRDLLGAQECTARLPSIAFRSAAGNVS
ncbi:hypothetical protein G6F40_016502 [Rhizopus arrhizus]|nr:hypothetical protein G6F40_016502 [Rhizopus arrhizus]